MPLIPLTSENKIKTSNDYPKLVLDYQERALVILIEPTPTMEYRHTLEAIEIGPDGKVLKETKEGLPGQKPYDVVVTDFIGQHLCFGNFDALKAKGIDPEGCPTCAATLNKRGVKPPKPHYAMHVIRYALKPNSWEIRDPFSVTCEAWLFAPNKFNQLVDVSADWDDIRKQDVKLGPCENKKYQKYDINVVPKAEWLKSADRKKRVAEEYANNKCDDLSVLIARRLDKSDVLEDIARVEERYAEAYGLTTSNTNSTNKAATAPVMDKDIAALLGENSDSTPEPASDPLDEFLPDKEAVSDPKKPTPKKKVAAKAEEPTPSVEDDSVDMDDVLDWLK